MRLRLVEPVVNRLVVRRDPAVLLRTRQGMVIGVRQARLRSWQSVVGSGRQPAHASAWQQPDRDRGVRCGALRVCQQRTSRGRREEGGTSPRRPRPWPGRSCGQPHRWWRGPPAPCARKRSPPPMPAAGRVPAFTTCTCPAAPVAGRRTRGVNRRPSGDVAYQSVIVAGSLPSAGEGQATCTRFVASTASDGPLSGHPSYTHLSSLTRTGVANVRPPSRETVSAMSRTSPGYTCRHTPYIAPSAPVVNDVLQQ